MGFSVEMFWEILKYLESGMMDIYIYIYIYIFEYCNNLDDIFLLSNIEVIMRSQAYVEIYWSKSFELDGFT